MSKHNLQLLTEAARLLKPLLAELVFVGGSTTALLITDKAAAEVRPTYDVDAIAEITSYAAYADFSQRLRKCGFAEDISEGSPICRWRQEKTILDVMPLDENISCCTVAVQRVAGTPKNTPKRSGTIVITQQHTQNRVDS